MLRARKKDVRIKPNRKLDKRSSRGMLYENEELRLRTIEINAEVERGQTDIKKLRRENDHLRREMWALRDEYERLEKLIKHLDLAGTGSEDHHHSQHPSDGEGGAGTERDDDDEGDDDDRASPSINGRHSNSEGSDNDDREADEKEPGEGVPMAISRSKSQTAMAGDFRHSTSAPTASNSDFEGACYCNEAALATANCDRHRVGQGGAVYVECGNPVKDNIENYQKAYGRMPRRCSSAGAKVYVATQHFRPHVPSQTAAVSSPVDSNSRVCYESLSAVKSRYSTSGMEDEDGYAACSHPVRVDLRDFLHPVDHPSECPNHFTVEASKSLMPPNTPPPPVPSPATTTIITTAIHHPVHGREGVEDMAEEGESSCFEAEDEPSGHISEVGGVPPDTPSEDGEFDLDHLVDIVRSFQQEQQLHQSGLVVATCSGSPPTPSTPDVLVEETEDDAGSNYSSSPGTSGMATIKRRPLSGINQLQQQRHRQMAIIEKEPASPLAMDVASGTIRPSRAIAESCSTDIGVGDSGGSATFAQQTGRVAGWSSMPQRRNSFSSSSSSSASGSPTAIHSSTVVFLNNNNNNTPNINNNKKLAGSSGYLGRGGVVQGPDTTIAVTAANFSTSTTTTIDGIVVTSTRKSTSPIRIVHPSHVLPVPPPISSYDVPRALQPPMALTNHGHSFGGALSRRRADETNRGLADANCLSVYPLPDGDASASLLRLHAVDPHTVSFDLKDVAAARSISVQEVIDQLEQQLDPARCHVRGVRMLAGSLFFISLDSVRSLQYLMRHSFRLRGHRVRLTDVSAQTWIVSLSGVPHYISDATVSLLLAAFGTIIGDVERRFFHGVDTGERLVRFRLKAHAKLPKHITVGGCRIQVRRMSPAPNASQRDHSGSGGGFGTSSSTTSHPTGMSRRVKLESQNDEDNSDFAFSSTAPDEGMSSAMAAESHYGTIQSASAEMGRKYMPKIGRSFEYRSQLRVDLRMSAEVPVPSLLNDEPASSPGPSLSVAPGSRVPPTPNCLLCEQQQQQAAPPLSTPAGLQPQVRPQLAPPQPSTSQTMVIHRCRHHESPAVSSPVGQSVPVAVATATVPPGEGRVHRESPPKSRVSVNFDETAAISSGSRINSGTGTGRPSNTKTSTSTSSNGILRKSVSGEEPSTESGNDGSNSATGFGESGQGKGKNGLRLAAAKKTARSFSLVDTFRVNKERRKPVVRVETVIENTSAANPEEGVRTLVVRRDSTESSSRSSRSSRKSNELPWCGCWGNGCL